MATKYFDSTPVGKAIPFDNSTNGFTATNVQSAIEEVKNKITPSLTVTQIVYVMKNGDDTNGNGSIGAPYLTIATALTNITDSSPTKRYAISVGPGDYSENLVLKANVFVIGTDPIATRITGSTVNINDATWNNSGNDNRSGFQDITLNNVATWDFTAQAGNTQGKLYFYNIRSGAAWTFTALNAINQAIIQDTELFGTTTFNGMQGFISSTTWQSGNIVQNSSSSAGIPAILTVNGGQIGGNITSTWTSNSANTLNLAGLIIGASTVLTASGASCTVNVNDGSLPVPANRSFTSSAILNRINDNFAKGLLSATTNIDVSAATAPSAGQVLIATSSTAAQWGSPNTLITTEVTATGGITAGTGADTLMTSMTITPVAGTYIAWFDCDLQCATTGASTTFSFYVGGSQVAASVRKVAPFDGGTLSSLNARCGVAIHGTLTVNGSQAIEVRWSASNGTNTAAARTLTILRVA